MQCRPLSIIQPCESSAVCQGPLDQSVWPEAPLHVGWQERKRGGAVVSLGGSTMVKQARMLSRAGTPPRHGLWIGRRSPAGIERQTAAVVAHETAQLLPKWIRNEQDRPKYIRYSMISHWEQCLHDRIPNRRARCDHPLDQSCSNAGRDRL